MRICIVILLILAVAGPVIARDETLLGDDIENGGYGAFVVKYGRIMGTDGFFVGGFRSHERCVLIFLSCAIA